MKKAAIAMIIGSVIGLSACQQQEADPMAVKPVVLETAEQKEAYAIGSNLGLYVAQRLKSQEEMGMVHDKALVVQGFIASLQEKGQLSQEELQELITAVETKSRELQQAQSQKAAQENVEKGKAYLAENAKREGVTVTDSGLQYEVMTQGEGEKPGAQDTVKVHYKGTLLDGTEFDSSYSRGEPATFPLHRVISGWTEGVQLMPVGSKFKFHIPSELAYGERATGKITANSTLIFEVELLEIVSKAETASE